jgi:hypothetical protein
MKQRRRIYYSAAQRAEIWDRWRRGESVHDIGRLFDRGHSSIFSVLAPSGGIRPPPRTRSRLALSLPGVVAQFRPVGMLRMLRRDLAVSGPWLVTAPGHKARQWKPRGKLAGR